jgi:hypothetical protein
MDDLPLKLDANPQLAGRIHEWCYFEPCPIQDTIKLVTLMSDLWTDADLDSIEVQRQFDVIHNTTGGVLGRIVPFIQMVEQEIASSCGRSPRHSSTRSTYAPSTAARGLSRRPGELPPRHPDHQFGERPQKAEVEPMNCELKIEHSVVYETVQAINMERGTPASAADVVEALPEGDQVEIEPRLQPAGRREVYEILSDLAREELHNGDGTRSRRAYQRVSRAGLVEGTAYYTVPGIDGVAEYLELLRLRAEWPALEADVRLRSLNVCPLPSVLKGRAPFSSLPSART